MRSNILEFALQGSLQHLTHVLLPPLTRVSHQLRREALPIFFSTTKFIIAVFCNFDPFTKDYGVLRKRLQYEPGTICLPESVRNLIHAAGDAVVVRHVKFYAYNFVTFEDMYHYLTMQQLEKKAPKETRYLFQFQPLVSLEIQYRRDAGLSVLEFKGDHLFANCMNHVLPFTPAVKAKAYEVAAKDEFKGFDLEDFKDIVKGFCVSSGD